MSKQVRETAPAKQISAFVILSPECREVATVQAYFSAGGACWVDVWGPSTIIHQGRVSGYGYDKFTAALAGAVIDGIRMADHSATDEESQELLHQYHMNMKAHFAKEHHPTRQQYWDKRVAERGMYFANFQRVEVPDIQGNTEPVVMAQSLFLKSGLDRLEAMGYKVFRAI